MSVIDFIEEIELITLKRLYHVESPISLCRLPYPGHREGCPNVGRSHSCPPYSIRLGMKYDLKKPCYFVYVKFNIKKQEVRMLKLHPNWTKKQARCLLYWQNVVRRELKEKAEFYAYRPGLGYELIPEAMGLHVFETALYHGIKIERNYSKQKYIYKIAFIGELRCQH